MFLQLGSRPLRILITCEPFIVRLLYRFDEAIVGELVSCCTGAILATYNMRFLQLFQSQTRNSPSGSRRTAKSKPSCSGRSYQSCSKPTSQFPFSDSALTGCSSSLNGAIVIASQSIIHIAEPFDVFGGDQTRSIAAGVGSILPFRGQIFPERL